MSLPPADVRVGRDRARLRALSAVVLLVVAVIAVAGFVVTRQVVHDQEKRLLKQRADEAGIYLSSALATVNGNLSSINSAAALSKFDSSKFAAGSMGPKVGAACDFVATTGRRAAIGALADIERIVAGEAGTIVEPDAA